MCFIVQRPTRCSTISDIEFYLVFTFNSRLHWFPFEINSYMTEMRMNRNSERKKIVMTQGKLPSSRGSVQFSLSVTSNSLQPHGLQHARPPCPSPTPRVYSTSCPLSRWCHPTISSFLVPFTCFQPFPALRSFQMSQFFASGGQSIGAKASASVLPMNI